MAGVAYLFMPCLSPFAPSLVLCAYAYAYRFSSSSGGTITRSVKTLLFRSLCLSPPLHIYELLPSALRQKRTKAKTYSNEPTK
ncbi:hypothetical protein BKA57DRAFT_468843 [Linnemannia elongata]|nr:hypothetical protein BKA57DRAFT_468843 [Linnemannia elongata]